MWKVGFGKQLFRNDGEDNKALPKTVVFTHGQQQTCYSI
jgi:hypothetical protein